MLTSPVLLITYNRPEVTKQVFDQIRKIRPKNLFLSSDGPKSLDDAKKIKQTRDLLEVDWECNVHTLFRDVNLGCKQAVSSAISWAFSHTDKLIILEDDTLPDLSFFGYANTLLERYQHEKTIFSITGVSWQPQIYINKNTYYFSKYPGIWGWATWKDRWELFEEVINHTPEEIPLSFFNKFTFTETESKFHKNNIESAINGKIDTWDFIWHYTHFLYDGLCLVPYRNLVSNLGFGNDATHTQNPKSWKSKRRTFSLKEKISHPKQIKRNIKADRYISETIFLGNQSWKNKLLLKAGNLLGKI